MQVGQAKIMARISSGDIPRKKVRFLVRLSTLMIKDSNLSEKAKAAILELIEKAQ